MAKRKKKSSSRRRPIEGEEKISDRDLEILLQSKKTRKKYRKK